MVIIENYSKLSSHEYTKFNFRLLYIINIFPIILTLNKLGNIQVVRTVCTRKIRLILRLKLLMSMQDICDNPPLG